MKVTVKIIVLTLLHAILNIAFASTSAEGVKQLPNAADWTFIDYKKGGFDSKLITLLVKRTTDGKAAISLHDEDFSVAVYDSRPQCNRLRGIELASENRCSLRLRVDGEIFKLNSKENWWVVFSPVGVGVGFLQTSINNLDSKASAKFLLKARDLELEIFDGTDFFVYRFGKNSLFK